LHRVRICGAVVALFVAAALALDVTPALATGKSQTITFTPPGTPVSVGTSEVVQATAESGKQVLFTIDGSSTAACGISEAKVSGTNVSEAKVSFTSAGSTSTGSCVVDANQAGDGEWAPAAQVPKTITVNVKPQTITFTPPATPELAGTSEVLQATAESGNQVIFTIDGSSTAACAITEAKVSGTNVSEAKLTFTSAGSTSTGSCVIDANQSGSPGEWASAAQVAKTVTVNAKPQSITFTPASPVVAGTNVVVDATASSGLQITFTIDGSGTGGCVISEQKVSGPTSEATISFTSAGTCVVDANQAGVAGIWEPAPQVGRTITVNTKTQTITFIPPASPKLAGTTEVVEAMAESGQPVTFTIDGSSTAGCAVSEQGVSPAHVSQAKVSFTSAGTCVIDASQPGTPGEWAPAAEVGHAVTVNLAPSPGPTSSGTSSGTSTSTTTLVPTPEPTPNSTFKAVSAAYNPGNSGITFTETVSNPGTFSWLFTFQNGKFGAFAASKGKCKAGFVKLKGKCRPAKIVFAKGSEVIAAAGTVSFTVKPSASAYKALKNAFKKKSGLPVTAVITFQSSLGAGPVSHVQSLIFKLTKN
jgi:hypothetical protein